MTAPFLPGVGAVLSADVAVPDHEAEVRFYARVLSTGEAPLWREDLMNNLGLPIIGLGADSPEYAGLPRQWMPHVQVADVAASVERAEALGAAVLTHAKDDEGRSQWAVLQDPNGAAFGLIPVVPAEAIPVGGPGAPAPDTPVGRIGWLDLTVPDADRTRDFYRSVVGSTVHEVEMTDGDEGYADYAMLGEHGNAVGGVCHARGANTGLPPVWLLYLTVADLSESLRRVEEEGGSVVKVARGSEGAVSYAAVRDPVGLHFALVAG